MPLTREEIISEGWLDTRELSKALSSRQFPTKIRTIRKYQELNLIHGEIGPPKETPTRAKYRLYYHPAVIDKIIQIRNLVRDGYKLGDLSKKEMSDIKAKSTLRKWRDENPDAYEKTLSFLQSEQQRTELPIAEAWRYLTGGNGVSDLSQTKQLYILY